MKKWQESLYQFMSGRYGSDQLNIFLLIAAVVLLFLNIFVLKSEIVSIISWLLLILEIFRTYSRNIYKRRQENEKFLALINPFKKQYLVFKNNRNDKEHKYFLCPSCKQLVRVPKGRGKITITCPTCKTRFDKKS